MIVAQQGRSISDIFAQDGEPAFRDMETALLVKMLTEKNDTCVISTGGGMPVQKENRNLLRQLGTVVRSVYSFFPNTQKIQIWSVDY